MLIKKIRKIDKKASYHHTLCGLKILREMYIRIYKTKLVVRTEIHSNAKIAFRALGISFCKKVSIPCQVFAFTDTRHYDVYEDYQVKLDNEIVVPNNFQLVEMYSSKIKHSDFCFNYY